MYLLSGYVRTYKTHVIPTLNDICSIHVYKLVLILIISREGEPVISIYNHHFYDGCIYTRLDLNVLLTTG